MTGQQQKLSADLASRRSRQPRIKATPRENRALRITSSSCNKNELYAEVRQTITTLPAKSNLTDEPSSVV